MTDYIFLPVATGQTIIWTNTALWSTGTVPNSADASVYIPAVLLAQSAQAYNFNLDIPPGQSFSIASLAVAQDTFDVQGNLTIADAALLGAGAALNMQGGVFTAGGLNIAASPKSSNGILGIFGYGSVAVGGAMVNDGAITNYQLKSLSVSSGSFFNAGTISADDGLVSITATKAGGGLNMVGSTLVGGIYQVTEGGSLQMTLGGPVVTDAATIELISDSGATNPNLLAFYDPVAKAFVPIETSLTTIAAGGILSVDWDSYTTANSLTVAGELQLKDLAKVSLGGLTISASGLLNALGSGPGVLTSSAAIANNGLISLTNSSQAAADLIINGDIGGSGSILIGAEVANGGRGPFATAILELNGTVAQTISFADGTGTLILDQPQKFAGTLAFAGSGDKVELTGIALSSVTGMTYSGTATGGTLAITEGGTLLSFKVAGDYTQSDFSLSAGPQLLVTSTPSLILTESAAAPAGNQTIAQVEYAFSARSLTAPVQVADVYSDYNSGLVFDNLEPIAAAGDLASVTITDVAKPIFYLSPAEVATDAAALAAVTNAYSLFLNGISAAAAVADVGKAMIVGFGVSDSTAQIAANLDGLQNLLTAGQTLSVSPSDPGTGPITVSEAQLVRDQGALDQIENLVAIGLKVTNVTASDAFAVAAQTNVLSVAITDNTAAVAANLGALESLAKVGLLASITLTDGGTPVLDLTSAQQSADGAVLAKIAGFYSLSIISQQASTVSAEVAVADYQSGTITGSLAVSDSAPDVSASLDQLNALVVAGKISSISLSDGGAGTLSVTPQQILADAAAINAISGNPVISIDGDGANLTLSGVSLHGNVVSFSGPAADYGLTPLGNGVGFTLSGTSGTDSFSNIQELQFSDHIEIVAATPSPNGVSSGNVAELYAAVLGRLPDIAGLAYIENVMKANPTIPITIYAEWFLQSPEYTGNPAHNYAQTTAGDAQFITDTYHQLLGRAPEAGAVAYFQNLIGLITQGTTPGTAAYSSAEFLAHASILADFSASAEFLQDVQVTAKHPADAAHWLVLI